MEEEDGRKELKKNLQRRMEGQVRVGWAREKDGKSIQEDGEERFLMSEGRMVVLGKMLKKIVRSRRERIFEEDWRGRGRVGGSGGLHSRRDRRRFFKEEWLGRGGVWEGGGSSLLVSSRFDRESNRIWSLSSAVGFPLSARV
jgi:hypothetical protein